MPEHAVVDWESTIHKNVWSKDTQDAGNVDAIQGDTVELQVKETANSTIYQNLR